MEPGPKFKMCYEFICATGISEEDALLEYPSVFGDDFPLSLVFKTLQDTRKLVKWNTGVPSVLSVCYSRIIYKHLT